MQQPGFSKTLLLIAYAFGWQAFAKLVSLYADIIGRDTDVPLVGLILMLQIVLCGTAILIYAWFGVDIKAAADKTEKLKYERRRFFTLVMTIALTLTLWIGYGILEVTWGQL